MTKCFDILSQQIKDLLPEELDDILKEMRKRQVAYMRAGDNANDAAAKASRTVADDMRIAAARAETNAAMNLKIRQDGLDFVMTQFNDMPHEGMWAILGGSEYAGEGTRMGANQMQRYLERSYHGELQGGLTKAGLFKEFVSNAYGEDVAKAMWFKNDKAELAKLPKQARDIAEVLHNVQERARVDANKAGAWIGQIPEYIVRQSHDAHKMMGRFTEWRDNISPKLNWAKMFPEGVPDAAGKEAYLKAAHENITTGSYAKADPDATKMAAFTGPANFAKRLSQEREFEFNSAADWYAYNTEFGGHNLSEAFVGGLSAQARTTGAMRVLGTNPEYNLRSIYDAVAERLKGDENLKRLDKLKTDANPYAKNTRFDSMIDQVLHKNQAPVNRSIATGFATLGNIVDTTSLPFVVLTQFSDVAFKASEMSYMGDSFLSNLAKGITLPLSNMMQAADTKAARNAIANEGSFYSQGIMDALHTRFSSQNSNGVPGALAKYTRFMMKAYLVPLWDDAHKKGSTLALMGHLGAYAETPHAELPPKLINGMRQYGIDKGEWETIRTAVRDDGTGRKFTSPAAVREQPLANFNELAKPQIEALKQGIAEKVQKRMQKDQTEQQWVSDRGDKLQRDLAEAHAKLNEKTAGIDERADESRKDISRRIVDLYSRIDAAKSYWSGVNDRIPSVSQVTLDAIKGDRARRSAAALDTLHERAVQGLLELKASHEVKFTDKWDARMKGLQESLAKRGDPAEANARLGQFDDAFAEANAKLTEKLSDADAATSKRLSGLRDKMAVTKKALDESTKAIQAATDAKPTAGELRKYGVREGRDMEGVNDLKAIARQLTRDIEKRKEELGQAFTAKWTERGEDLAAFADKIKERINSRAEWNSGDLASLEPKINTILENTREDVASKLGVMISDRVDHAMPINPDAKTRSVTKGALRSGTWMGGVLGELWRFKSFPVTVIQRVLQREMYGYGARRAGQMGYNEYKGLAQLFLAATSMGYLGLSAKALLTNKTPPPVDKDHFVKTFMDSAKKGGAGSFMGDVLFTGEPRSSSDAIMDFLGPSVRLGGDLLHLGKETQFIAGKSPGQKRQMQKEVLALAQKYTPGVNTLYTKALFDYYVFDEIKENLSPGSTQRTQANLKKESGQTTLIPNSGAGR